MANKKITDLTVLATLDDDADVIAVDDVSATESKRATIATVRAAMMTAVKPSPIDKSAATEGTGLKAAREDHVHEIAPALRNVNTSPITLAAADGVLLVDTSAARTINLPAPVGLAESLAVLIIDGTGGANGFPITLAPNAAESIDGLAESKVLRRSAGRWWLWTDGTNWFTAECLGQKHNLSASGAPSTTDDTSKGYQLGSLWVDQNDFRAWVFVGEDSGDGQWLELARHVAIVEETAGFTLAVGHDYVRITSASAITVNLPDPSGVGARRWKFLLSHNTPGNVTLSRFGSESIQGVAADYVMSGAWSQWELVCDGTDWWFF